METQYVGEYAHLFYAAEYVLKFLILLGLIKAIVKVDLLTPVIDGAITLFKSFITVIAIIFPAIATGIVLCFVALFKILKTLAGFFLEIYDASRRNF